MILKLCTILILPLIVALVQAQVMEPGSDYALNQRKGFTCSEDSPDVKCHPKTSECSFTPLNTKSTAYCYKTWPTQLPFDFEEVIILNFTRNNLTKAVLKNIRPTQVLRIINCNVKTIERSTFDNQAITVLDLSGNMIRNLNATMFIGLIGLQKLILSKNKIIHIELRTFFDLKTLNILDLEYNQLTTMPKELPEKLEECNLGYNNLEEANTPLEMSSLKSLNLCGNGIKKYHNNFLRSCRNLESLCIGNKTLESTTSFPFTIVQGLKNLTIIGDDSELKARPNFADAFTQLTELENLTIIRYKLPNWNFLENLKELHVLRLKWVQVQVQLKQDDFKNCPKLEVLDLARSEEIAKDFTENQMFLNLQSLKKLILTDCNIEHLGWLPTPTPTSVKHKLTEPKLLPKLKVLDISKNPLKCKEDKTQYALCYLNQMTANFSSHYSTDPTIGATNLESATPSNEYTGYTDAVDDVKLPSDHDDHGSYQEELMFQLMEPQDTKCNDWNQASVPTISHQLCKNLTDLPNNSDGNKNKFPDLKGSPPNQAKRFGPLYLYLALSLAISLYRTHMS